jgi:hypothetical protein
VIIGHHPPPAGSIWVEVFFDSGNLVRVAAGPANATIEDQIALEFGEESYASLDPGTPQERVVLASLERVAVNAMLLLAEWGCKKIGPANESHYRRLQHFADMARKRGRGVEEAQRSLRLASQIYGFPQDVVLHEEARAEGGSAADGESQRRPHWRRGHWKMHAHGPGLSQRKRLFIKPVFVNRHLLAESQNPFATSYRVAAGKGPTTAASAQRK